MTKYISELNNGDSFHQGACDYIFVGKMVFKGIESYVGCNQTNGVLTDFPSTQLVIVPRSKPVRTDSWYKKKFLELTVQHSISYDRVEYKFSKISSQLLAIIDHVGSGVMDLGAYGRDGYIITVSCKVWKGTTIMLINTVTGKSVACKHIDPKKVTADNIQLILFDLYKKYMNQ